MANAHNLLMAQRAAMMGGKALPYDAEVEFLRSDIGQYINTNVYYAVGNSYEINVTCSISRSNDGTGWDAGGLLRNHDGKWNDGSLNGIGIATIVSDVNQVIQPGADGKTITTVGELSLTRTHQRLEDYAKFPYLIFAYASMQNILLARMEVYGFSMSVNASELINLKPVRFTNENGETEGAMYNRLGVGGNNPDGSPRNDGLFRNQGTGVFIIGPDKT